MFSRLRPPVGQVMRLGLAAYSGAAIFVSAAVHSVSSLAVEGSSMSPALSPNFDQKRACDRVLFSHYKPTRALNRGDVVVFWTPHNPDKMAIKRVVGLPGDEVVPFPEKPYSEWLRQQPTSTRIAVQHLKPAGGGPDGAGETECVVPSVIVPINHVWVEGDNWRSTHDSNDYGPISQSLITGKALWILTPSRFGPVETGPINEPIIAGRVKAHVGQPGSLRFF